MSDEERLKKLQARIDKKKQLAEAKKALETAKANLKKIRGK